MTASLYLRCCSACTAHVGFDHAVRAHVDTYAYCPPCLRAAQEAFDPRPGDEVALFDGNPQSGRFVVTAADGDDLTVVYRRPGHADGRGVALPVGVFDPTGWRRHGISAWSPRGRS